MDKDRKYLDAAIKRVTDMIATKNEIWTEGRGTFENFDDSGDIGITPLQSGLNMCKLKMKRAITRYNGKTYKETGYDPDLEDSLLDLASFAILTLGILNRDGKPQTDDFKLDAIPGGLRWSNGKTVGPDEIYAWQKERDAEYAKDFTDRYLKSPEGMKHLGELAKQYMSSPLTPTE